MNGPEHYHEAETLIGVVKVSADAPAMCAQLLVEAQIHATLALAAAVGGLDWSEGTTARWAPDEKRWREIVAPEQVQDVTA